MGDADDRAWRALKFGGTSVGTAAALAKAVEIAEAAARERRVLIVVSALSGVTNALDAALAGAAGGTLEIRGFACALRERHLTLLGLVASGTAARRATAAVKPRIDELRWRLEAVGAARRFSAAARASVLALGERLSVPVFAAALQSRGLAARTLDAAALIRTDDSYGEAEIRLDETRRLTRASLASLPEAAVPVVTGFIGATASGETTLLGRGASDLTAAVLGWAVDAERVEIWSDVDGVMNADPRLVKGARTLPFLTYAEAAALAHRGAKVLHPRTLEPLAPVGIPLFVGNTLRPGPGTWIGPQSAVQQRDAKEAGTAA